MEFIGFFYNYTIKNKMGFFTNNLDIYKERQKFDSITNAHLSTMRVNLSDNYERFGKQINLDNVQIKNTINSVLYIDLVSQGYNHVVNDYNLYCCMLCRNLPIVFCDNDNYINLYKDYMFISTILGLVDSGKKIKENQLPELDTLITNLSNEFERIISTVLKNEIYNKKLGFIMSLTYVLVPQWIRLLTHFNANGGTLDMFENRAKTYFEQEATDDEVFYIKAMKKQMHG